MHFLLVSDFAPTEATNTLFREKGPENGKNPFPTPIWPRIDQMSSSDSGALLAADAVAALLKN